MKDYLMFIKKDELVIRSSEEFDARILCEWWNDGSIMAHAGFPLGLNTTVEEVEDIIKKNDIQKKMLLIIEINNLRVGEMSYSFIDEKTCQIGIKICKQSFTSRRYGPRLLSILIDYLFNELRCKKIILDTNILNIRAQKCYKKLGFKELRININSWKDQLGCLQSSVDYELIKEDFIYYN